MSLEAINITSSTETHDGRDVYTIDIPGTYLHTYSYEEVTMIQKGQLPDILVNVDPNLYRKYVVLEKGVKVLYAKIKMINMG